MGLKLTLMQRFKRAREANRHDIDAARAELIKNPATNQPYSDRYIAEAIKYPDKNPDLHNSVVNYCENVEKQTGEMVTA